MKNLLKYLAISGILFSCSAKEESKNQEDYGEPATTTEVTSTAVDNVSIGEALVNKSDCTICHHKTNRIMGPSHTEVAEKYEFNETNVKMIAGKIINGGSGVWGDILMTPHADISQQDAENMARYVLSLDGEKEH
ncbi:MAG: cytochrome C552 [Flammeovirgaceae bacterium]|nr:cytochrome C552 [Flammeovirgaceae bacterium]